MKRTLLFAGAFMLSALSYGQTQIGNGDMEIWPDNDEPANWNSFLTATGGWAWAASDQCDESTDTRPGSAGSSSANIFSTSTFSIVANGNLTLGKINMGSTTPTDPSNYNFTDRTDVEHSEALTDQPDSIVFWAKFTPNGGSGNARMKASLHTDYDYQDPEDAASSAELVANAVINYPSTGGNWMRFSVPFDYNAGPATNNAYILVTFTTNEIAGGGDAGDEVLIDDVELIYNGSNSIDEVENGGYNVAFNNSNSTVSISSTNNESARYEIYNTLGQTVQRGDIGSNIPFDAKTGVYFVHVIEGGKVYSFEILKK